MNAKVAKQILTLGFSESYQQRMEHLAGENQKNRLTETEKEELISYQRTGHLLELLQSRARRYLEDNKDGQ